ncbi:phage major capsid protein, P2 family [Azohydromonas lata]|uniref:Phage major capsid protein, P2 family n=1 Tax=Azohydromonas lata TaxID=45677 RepID=A0ABU5IDF7_9BURK|nr:phage major capsid protein, P2 family [Azohydromonas lata]MDZ5457013.1 phage major capsid protein, P2 family [Azohydromonas lata]
MRNDTRLAFNAYLTQLAALSGVAEANTMFTVAPSVQQKLETKIQESSTFLSSINMIGVTELKGDKLGLGVSGPVAGRTNTATKDRATRDITTMDSRGYECSKTNFDTHITYAKLDAWAKFPDFQARVRDAIVQRQALDRMLIGFHGVSPAAETDLAQNPLLQDVNRGWLQALREEAAARVMDHGKEAGKVTYGVNGDYENLDALVFDAVMLLDPWFREDPNLRVFVSRDLMHDKLFPLVNQPKDPSEKIAADLLISQKRLGGLQAVQAPFFPDGTVLVTSFSNLSIYFQEGARRRRVEDNPKRDRIENYESSNDAYVVEEYGMAALVEKIEPKAAA